MLKITMVVFDSMTMVEITTERRV